MTSRFTYSRVHLWLAAALSIGLVSNAGSQQPPGQEGHASHHPAWVEAETEGEVRVVRVTPAPEHFVGTVMYDAGSQRLWLLSYGPPANTKGPSTLFEVEPRTGKPLARATMPFLGEFGGGAVVNGSLYHVVPYQSTLYRVAVSPSDGFGRIVGTTTLPTLNDVKVGPNDVFRVPFITFTAVLPSSDGRVVLYASDLGEFWDVDVKTGRPVNRVRTVRGLAGATPVTFGGRTLVLATFDPVDAAFKAETRQFMFRAAHGILPLETVRAQGNYGHSGQKTVTWVLVDAASGEVLASTAMESSRLEVGSVALLGHEAVPGTRYGRLTALTTGDEGLLTVEWTPR
jgi:hypothetical protein